MRNLVNRVVNRQVKTIAKRGSAFFYLAAVMCMFLFAACKKNGAESSDEEQAKSARDKSANQEFINSNAALPAQTVEELFQVRAATEKYLDTAAAKADGFVNTGIQLPNMGLHFANFGRVTDGIFDLTKPEFLVYNKLPNGKFELVAVEYGVPIDPQHTNVPPAGFTGDADEWDFNTLNLGLWTLHAWVWKTNPAGVFKMENPIVP
jgi:hypothetical protein